MGGTQEQVTLILEQMDSALVPSTAVPRHQQSPCSKAFQRILIDHLRAPDTLTTVFFPGGLQPTESPQPWDPPGGQGAPDGS